jgi:hypothetical protein
MSLEHMLQDEQEAWRFLLEQEFGMKDQLVKIANHLQGQLDHLDKLSASDDHIVSFDQYKAVYDTLIALRQAQASEQQAEQLARIAVAVELLERGG